MGLLIEVPQDAKIRIESREAEAEAMYDRVQKACEEDVAKARSEFGGYFDLHRETLDYLLGQAQQTLKQAAELRAQMVFTAHATEYRLFLRDPGAVKPVLANMRETVIKKYGEQVRTAIQSKETQQMEIASRDWTPDLEAGSEYTPPPLAGGASFWRARRNDFRENNTGENIALSAGWDSLTDRWRIYGSANAQSTFRSLATLAAKGFRTSARNELWRSWLDELRRRKSNYSETPITAAYSQRAMEDPSKFEIEPPKAVGEVTTGVIDKREMTELFGEQVAERHEGRFAQTQFKGVRGTIQRLFETSMNLCLEFEALAPSKLEESDGADRLEKEQRNADVHAGERKVKGQPARRSQKYRLIDEHLREIAEARPSSQLEVFQMLEGRKVILPNCEPFTTARGWMNGFRQKPTAARAWLSKRWAELKLPSLPRGPKK